MNMVEKRRSTLINITFYALIVAVYYFFVKYAAGLVAPFIVAFLVALFLQKPVRFVSKKTKINQKFVAAFALMLILSVFIGLAALVGYRIAVEFRGLGQYLIEKIKNLPELIKAAESWIINRLAFLPDSLESSATGSVSDFADKLLVLFESGAVPNIEIPDNGLFDISMLSAPLGSLLSTAKQIPSIFAATLISVVACFFLTCDYDGFTGVIKKNISKEHAGTLIRVKKLFGEILGKMFKSYATIMFITFCEVAIGLNILKLIGVYEGGYIIAISMVIAVVDIFPVLGTGTVLWPWSAISFMTGNIGMGIGLLVLYAVISVLRQVIEPKLVSMKVGIHPIFTLLGMYLGVQLFGVLGIFILPITFFLVKALNDEGIIHLFGYDEKKADKKA